MFERYTERARRVIFFARYETSAFGARSIETEHLLMGLLREETSLLQRLLERPDIDGEMRARISARTTRSPEKISTSADLPLSEECKGILKHSGEEADRLGNSFIGTEHLLLGILRETGCLAAKILTEAGVTLDAAREAVAKSLPEAAPLSRLPLHAELPAVHDAEERNSLVRRTQDGAIVVETTQCLGTFRISVRERFQLSSDGKKLQYTHEIRGQRPEQHRTSSYDFDVN